MKINLEFGIDGTVRAYVKMQGTEAHLLGANAFVTNTLMDAFRNWITDITSEVVSVEDTPPDIMISTRVFEPNVDFFTDPSMIQSEDHVEYNEPKNTPIPNYLNKSIEDIFNPSEE